jgi:flagellar assembly protein FliH
MNTSSRSVLRGARTEHIDLHAFVDVDELPRPSVDRPLSTGDARVDAIRAAAWDEGVSMGAAEGRARGFDEGRLEGIELGRREGFAAGNAEARATAEAVAAERVGSALDAMDAAIDDLQRRDAVVVAEIERSVVDLAVGLAAAILQREIAIVDDAGADAVRRALRLAPSRGDVIARLAPGDVDNLLDVATIAPGRNVEVVADPSVAPGGCIVDVGAARIDASIDGALDRARSALLGEGIGS